MPHLNRARLGLGALLAAAAAAVPLSAQPAAEVEGIYQDEVAERIRYARGRLAARIAAVFAALQPKEDGP